MLDRKKTLKKPLQKGRRNPTFFYDQKPHSKMIDFTPDPQTVSGWIIPAIMATSALVQSLIQRRNDKKNAERTNQANMKMAEYQYSKDLEMWNKSNEYNSPQEQMKRLGTAQLNPNLVYGGGNVTGNSGGQLPKYQAPTMDMNYSAPNLGVAGMVQQYQDYRMKQEQTDNLKAQRKAIEADTALKVYQGKLNAYTWSDKLGVSTFNRVKAEQETMKRATELGGQSQLLGYQLQFREGANRNQDTANRKMLQEMERMSTATEFEKMKMDWYSTQMMSNLGSAGASIINKLMPKLGGKLLARPAGGFINPKTAERAKSFGETTKRMQDFGRKLNSGHYDY